MKATLRQLAHEQRRAAAALRDAAAPLVRDEPSMQPDGLRNGIARIVTNNEDGLYTITEQWWEPQDEEWQDAAAPLGLVEEPARDYTNCRLGAADQLVRFWQQHAQGGQIETLIDVHGGGWDGVEKVSAFCVHYSGVGETLDPFHTVPNCKYSFLEIVVDLRECEFHEGEEEEPGWWDHPGFARFGPAGTMIAWANVFNSASGSIGDDWTDLRYGYWSADDSFSAASQENLADFFIQARVLSASGDLQFRIQNLRQGEANTVSAIITAAIRVTPYPPPPGTQELGNCCCHDEWPEIWGEV